MRTLTALVLAGTVLAISTGCAARYIKKGDAAMLADRPAVALEQYHKALRKDSDLAEDPVFVAKLQRAEYLTAYQLGLRQAEAGQWTEAVRSFRDALLIRPDFLPAAEALERTKRLASDAYYQQAIRAADADRLAEAARRLDRAIAFEPANSDAVAALESIRRPGARADTEAAKLCEQARALQSRKRWGEAEGLLAETVRLDPNHLPARATRHRGGQQMLRAHRLSAEGAELAADKRLDEAIQTFRQALETWPYLQTAQEGLDEATRRRETAEKLFLAAQDFAVAGQWDSAVSTASACLELFPHHGQARHLLAHSRLAAATAHVERGDDLLGAGELDAAAASYRAALDYQPDMSSAREGLADVAVARGDLAAKANLWGRALLRYAQAAELDPQRAGAGKLLAARAAVTERNAFTLAVDVRPGQGAETNELHRALLAKLVHRRPDFMTIAAAGAADYRAVIDPDDSDIDTRLTGRRSFSKAYTVMHNVPNPAIHLLRLRLNTESRKLERLRRELNRKCHVCGGSKTVMCAACKGRGHVFRKTGKAKPKYRRLVCTTCRGKGRAVCSRCKGSGRAGIVTFRDVQNQQRKVARVRGQLSAAPPTVVRPTAVYWPYTVATYEKVGRLEVDVSVRGGSRTVKRFSAVGTFHQADEVVENANPHIGLFADGLNLPDDEYIRRRLSSGAGAKAGEAILQIVLADRIAAVRAEAARLERAGKADEAVEAEVDLAVLLEVSDPTESQRHLARLLERLGR